MDKDVQFSGSIDVKSGHLIVKVKDGDFITVQEFATVEEAENYIREVKNGTEIV